MLFPKNNINYQPSTKLVFADIEDEYREDEEAYNRIINTNGYFKWILYASFVIGIILTVPWPKGILSKPFMSEFSILIYVPLSIYFLSRLYLNEIKNSFKLEQRIHPEKAIEEDMFTVYVKITYKSKLPFSVAYISDRCFACKNLASPIKILSNDNFDNEKTLNLKYTVPLNRGYGIHKIGPMDLTVRDPFLFFEEKIVLPLETKVNVWLNPPPEEDIELINSSLLEPLGSAKSTKSGSGLDFYGLKEYVPGDDVRSICWSKSASLGKMVIKQFAKDCLSSVLIAIHTDRSQLRGLGFGNAMHRIFRISAAVIQETRSRGIPVNLALTQGKSTNLFSVKTDVPAYGFMTDILTSFDDEKIQAAEPEAAESLMNTICAEAGPGSIVLLLSHTLNMDYDIIFNSISALSLRDVKVVIWVIDDSKLLNFTGWQQKNKINPKEFQDKVEDLGIEFRIINPKEQYAKEEAYKEAGRLMQQ